MNKKRCLIYTEVIIENIATNDPFDPISPEDHNKLKHYIYISYDLH